MDAEQVQLIRNKIVVVPFRQLERALLRQRVTGVLNVARELNLEQLEEVQLIATRDDPVEPPYEYAKIPLHNDDNHAVEIMAAVHILRGLCERHELVAVCCQVAVNRSPAVVALWVAQQFNVTWQEAAAEVKAVRPGMNTHRGLLRTIRKILGASGPTQEEIDGAEY